MKKIEQLKLLLGVKKLTPELIKKQEKTFGFSIFIFDKIGVEKVLKNILKNKNIFKKLSSIFLIPHVYIFPLVFGGLFLNFLLSSLLGAEFLSFDFSDTLYIYKRNILDSILLLSLFLILVKLTLNIQKVLSKKMNLLYKCLILYNIDYKIFYKNIEELLSEKKGLSKKGFFNSNPWGGKGPTKLFMFLFSQPFIFGHGFFFGGFGFLTLVIFDIFVFLILFNKLTIALFYINYFYYKTKFFLMDYFPFLYGEKIKQRYFYKNLYDNLLNLDNSLKLLNNNISDINKLIINKDLGKGLSKTTKDIFELIKIVSDSKYLKDKSKFVKFLRETLNEAIVEYSKVFDALSKYSEKKELIGLSKIRVNMYREKLDLMKEKITSLKV